MTDNPSPPPSSGSGPPPPSSHFPTHDGPRVWVLSAGDSPIGISLTRQLLAHGDQVVAGITPSNPEREDPRRVNFDVFLDEISTEDEYKGWLERLETVELDIRLMSDCQVAIAAAIAKFGRIDILFCCTSQAIIGAVEELAVSERTQALVRDQFETNYFGPVNLIKAVLPQMRKQKAGHIMALGGITGHIGTPGLGVYCAAGWALEGFCDSIAYEIAPFNIRVSILQCNIEIGILSNLVTSVPPMYPTYSRTANHAPLFRGILNDILSRLPSVTGYPDSPVPSPISDPSPCSVSTTSTSNPEAHHEQNTIDANLHPLSAKTIVSLYPPLSPAHLDLLTAETIHAITAIGGHENPPARHIVGAESVASVKEKLKTISEELEDFIGCSSAVDIVSDENAMRVVSEETTAQAAIP
ncbi:short chain dehydrogenase/reductase [Coccidioides immitis RS]|uniref:Short chain dehydrogenase/reductase n=4 Tax=Coccidioides immitis TaxID=5501 RepID=A0A0E1RUH6_COCIM|nr:short chain dehydrogenase/reductase [Coccidioides immitis RS]EAS27594.2 short chain dehydrogenase/reductase [Coccidioides immitis RS]KMP09558.1 hypothetical protein CIRG_09728 [Coccidioides immitis RMSCC 2394]KMU90873.1 hypothetical protein CIHG_08529 [Coccidioides immitis H538.4]TPX20353.1 hypothetical protein DIZ76_016241 [Coccidioides immitis]